MNKKSFEPKFELVKYKKNEKEGKKLKKDLENFNKKNLLSKLSKFVSFNFNHKEDLDRNWVDNIWEALSIPERSVEIEGWLRANKGKALVLRGRRYQETMLHWGVLSTLSLTIALLECNLDINAKDKDGRTPFDWLMERYNVVFVTGEVELDKNGRSRLKAETQGSALHIWNIGARPSKDINKIKKGEDPIILSNIANGELWLIKLLYNSYGKEILTGWLKNKRSLIHIWALTPDSPMKKKGFEVLMSDLKLKDNILKNAKDEKVLSIDETDIDGRTSLWYALDGIFSSDQYDENLNSSIKYLLELGADPDKKDILGVSPRDILSLNKDNKKHDYIEVLFLKNKAK